jgi:hypothetical protein
MNDEQKDIPKPSMHETMNKKCFELTSLSRWYGQRHTASLLRWNTYPVHIALI